MLAEAEQALRHAASLLGAGAIPIGGGDPPGAHATRAGCRRSSAAALVSLYDGLLALAAERRRAGQSLLRRGARGTVRLQDWLPSMRLMRMGWRTTNPGGQPAPICWPRPGSLRKPSCVSTGHRVDGTADGAGASGAAGGAGRMTPPEDTRQIAYSRQGVQTGSHRRRLPSSTRPLPVARNAVTRKGGEPQWSRADRSSQQPIACQALHGIRPRGDLPIGQARHKSSNATDSEPTARPSV